MIEAEKILTLLKQEEIELTNLLEIVRFQTAALKDKDQERMKILFEEREEIAARIKSLYEERIKIEEGLLLEEREGLKELEEKKENLARIAREIIERDQTNEQEIRERMGKIEANLLALKKAKVLKESYLEGIWPKRSEAIFINKHR